MILARRRRRRLPTARIQPPGPAAVSRLRVVLPHDGLDWLAPTAAMRA